MCPLQLCHYRSVRCVVQSARVLYDMVRYGVLSYMYVIELHNYLKRYRKSSRQGLKNMLHWACLRNVFESNTGLY